MKLIFLALALFLSLGLLTSGTACAEKDTTPPTSPTHLAYKTANGNMTLVFSWEPSDDGGSGVEGYLVRASWGGTLSEYFKYIGASTSFWADAPRANGTCTFEVKALDKAYNESNVTSLDFTWEVPTQGQ